MRGAARRMVGPVAAVWQPEHRHDVVAAAHADLLDQRVDQGLAHRQRPVADRRADLLQQLGQLPRVGRWIVRGVQQVAQLVLAGLELDQRGNSPRCCPGSRPAAPSRPPASRPAPAARRAERGRGGRHHDPGPDRGHGQRVPRGGMAPLQLVPDPPPLAGAAAAAAASARPAAAGAGAGRAPAGPRHLHQERFWDAAPATVYATLLDEGSYLCSVSTMYRLLRAHGETGDRRRHATHPPA
jgi:hypothetical protein